MDTTSFISFYHTHTTTLEVDEMAKPRNYRGVSLPDELVERVEQLIEKLGTYRTIAEFVSEAVRLRLETLEKHKKREQAS
jgi:metal-responsive CopG/Arc/MetJ family transcriptional regulator